MLRDRSHLRKTDGCGERRALTAAEMFAQPTPGFWAFECVCVQMCEPQTRKCHKSFPAKHLAAVQDNRLVSEEVIIVSINSTERRLTPKSLTSCTGVFPQQTSLTAANTHVMCFQSRRECSYLPLRDNNSLLKLKSTLQSAGFNP